MTTKTFDASFRDAVAALHADAAAAGISMTAVCDGAGVSRATPHRYLNKIPTTIAAITKMQVTLANLKRGPCVKQNVTATIVAADGARYVGTNYCETPQTVCPRAGMPTGVDYELCRDICHQPAHAEVNAIAEAGEAARGGILYLEGHTYACDPCKAAAFDAGIAEIIIGAPPA